MEKNKAKCCGYGMFTGICWVVGLGIVLGVLLGPELAGYAAAFVLFPCLFDELVNQVSSVAQGSGEVCCVSGSCRGVIVKDSLKVALEILIGGSHQRSSGGHLRSLLLQCPADDR